MIRIAVGIEQGGHRKIDNLPIIISDTGLDLATMTPNLHLIEMTTSAVIIDRQNSQLGDTLMIDPNIFLMTGGRITGRVIIHPAHAIKATITNLRLTAGVLIALVLYLHPADPR